MLHAAGTEKLHGRKPEATKSKNAGKMPALPGKCTILPERYGTL